MKVNNTLYDSWEPFRNEARRLWSLYRDAANPKTIVRVAVRYINRIDIPGDRIDLKDYFRTSPDIAPELPQQLDGFFMQLNFDYPDVVGKCLLNQTVIPPAKEDAISVVLDVDLFRTDQLPQDEENLWNCFEILHTSKNDIFEACITEKTRRLFL